MNNKQPPGIPKNEAAIKEITSDFLLIKIKTIFKNLIKKLSSHNTTVWNRDVSAGRAILYKDMNKHFSIIDRKSYVHASRLPFSEFRILFDPFACVMKPKLKTSREAQMKVIRIPWNPIVAIILNRIRNKFKFIKMKR